MPSIPLPGIPFPTTDKSGPSWRSMPPFWLAIPQLSLSTSWRYTESLSPVQAPRHGLIRFTVYFSTWKFCLNTFSVAPGHLKPYRGRFSTTPHFWKNLSEVLSAGLTYRPPTALHPPVNHGPGKNLLILSFFIFIENTAQHAFTQRWWLLRGERKNHQVLFNKKMFLLATWGQEFNRSWTCSLSTCVSLRVTRQQNDLWSKSTTMILPSRSEKRDSKNMESSSSGN